MIGLRQLSNNRQELYASRFPLEILKPYLLDYYKEAFATVVLYEDNIEAYHETGIFSFDASEPETFNYEEFRAPLIEEFHDRLAICTVDNLFLHLERYMEERPMEDDPFHTLVFSISLAPPSRDVLLDWEKNIDDRLKRVLYDDRSTEHFQLFPDEVCVVYSHNNHFTSVTSALPDLIKTVFEDIVEQHLAPLLNQPLAPALMETLYHHTNAYGAIRLKPERVYQDDTGKSFLLITYPRQHGGGKKQIAKLYFDAHGNPELLSDVELISLRQYYLKYSDLSFLPIILTVFLMVVLVFGAFYFRVLFQSPPF